MSDSEHELQDAALSPNWVVWRIDDNGNRFMLSDHLKQEDAERLVAEFTARGHKQIYWAEREQISAGGQ
jgi:hypothetical protein